MLEMVSLALQELFPENIRCHFYFPDLAPKAHQFHAGPHARAEVHLDLRALWATSTTPQALQMYT